MAEVKVVDLVVPQGSTFPFTVSWVDPDFDDAPIDLTDYIARLHVRAKVGDPVPIYQTDNDVGGHITITPAQGKVRLEVPASVTALWTFKKAVYDLEVEDNAGFVTRLVKGTMYLDLEVTR